MTAAELLREVEQHGGRLARHGDGVRITAPAPLPGELMERLREHKAGLLRLLADATPDAAALPSPLPDPSAPCSTCGGGSFWHAADGWYCEGCAPAPADVTRWRNVSGGKPAAAPPPALPWPPDLNAMLKRVSTAFEWTAADRREFVAWARRSAQGLADARELLVASVAKLPDPGLEDRRRVVLAMLAADPALRLAWTCADDGASDPVLLTLAIRGKGSCELAIPRAKFDGLTLPFLIGELEQQRGEE